MLSNRSTIQSKDMIKSTPSFSLTKNDYSIASHFDLDLKTFVPQSLGTGTYAVVWKGTLFPPHTSGPLVVAIKEIEFRKGKLYEQKVEFTKTEISIHKKIEKGRSAPDVNQDYYNKVIRFYGFHQYREYGIETVKIIIDYVALGSLTHQIHNNQLSSLDRHKLFIDTAKGLAAMHKLDIIHRDVKPDNILVFNDGNWNVKLCDFGFAAKEKNLKSEEYLLGTPGYMDPTAIEGYKLPAKAMDIFALGIVYYELITRKESYSEEPDVINFRALRNKVVNSENIVSTNRITAFNRFDKTISDNEARKQQAYQMWATLYRRENRPTAHELVTAEMNDDLINKIEELDKPRPK